MTELREWLESLDYVLAERSPDHVRHLLEQFEQRAHQAGIDIPFTANTRISTLYPVQRRQRFPAAEK